MPLDQLLHLTAALGVLAAAVLVAAAAYGCYQRFLRASQKVRARDAVEKQPLYDGGDDDDRAGVLAAPPPTNGVHVLPPTVHAELAARLAAADEEEEVPVV